MRAHFRRGTHETTGQSPPAFTPSGDGLPSIALVGLEPSPAARVVDALGRRLQSPARPEVLPVAGPSTVDAMGRRLYPRGMACLFCRIVAGEIPAEIIRADAATVAFLDVTPLADGHVLVVPREHATRVEDLSPEAARGLFDAVHQLAGPLRTALGAEGTTIGINDGVCTGQTVPHVHVHIVPRRSGDGAGSIHSMFPQGRHADIAIVATRIRAGIGLP